MLVGLQRLPRSTIQWRKYLLHEVSLANWSLVSRLRNLPKPRNEFGSTVDFVKALGCPFAGHAP